MPFKSLPANTLEFQSSNPKYPETPKPLSELFLALLPSQALHCFIACGLQTPI